VQAGKQPKHAEFRFWCLGIRKHGLERIDQTADGSKRFAEHGFGHQRSRGLAEHAAATVEFDVAKALRRRELKIKINVVAAQRIVLANMGRGVIELAKIARVAVMLPQHVLIRRNKRHVRTGEWSCMRLLAIPRLPKTARARKHTDPALASRCGRCSKRERG